MCRAGSEPALAQRARSSLTASNGVEGVAALPWREGAWDGDTRSDACNGPGDERAIRGMTRGRGHARARASRIPDLRPLLPSTDPRPSSLSTCRWCVWQALLIDSDLDYVEQWKAVYDDACVRRAARPGGRAVGRAGGPYVTVICRMIFAVDLAGPSSA